MILLAAALLLGAVGLLAVGIAQGSSGLEWASFAASALAVLVLATGELRRRRRAADEPAHTRQRPEPGPVAARPPANAPSWPAEPVEPVEPMDTGHPDVGRPPPVLGPQTGRHGAPDPDPEPDVQLIAAASVPPPAAPPEGPPSGPLTPPPTGPPALAPDGEPPAEEVEFADLLMIMDLSDEVLVVDEHPRYHLPGCPYIAGLAVLPVPMDQARLDGFTPCGTCAPDRTFAARERARRPE